MRDRYLVVINILLLVFLTLMTVHLYTYSSSAQGCYLEDVDAEKYYFWGSNDYITVKNCSYGHDYCVVVGSNLKASEKLTINFSGVYGTYEVAFTQRNDPVNSTGDLVSQLEISLYEDDVLKDTTYRTVVFYDDQYDYGLSINLVIALIPLLIIGSLVIGIVYHYFKIR